MLKNFVLVVFVVFISGITVAQEKGKPVSVEALQKEMIAKTAGIQSVCCDFIQEKHMEYLETVITSTGKLIFDTRNRLRWEYQKPFEYLITINNGQFTISTDGETNTYDINSNQMFSKISELIISSVNGTIFTDSNFNVQAFDKENEYVIYLEPNIPELKEVLNKIEMHIAQKDFSVNKVVMYEMDDNYTEISFINKKFNESLPNHIFTAN